MNYTKPSLTALGPATRLIEHVGKIGNSLDPNDAKDDLQPVYDLDE